MLAASADAAFGGPKDAAVEAAVDKAVADWAPVLSCSATIPPDFPNYRKVWDEDRVALAQILIKGGVAPDVIARIADKTEPKAMTAPLEGSAADLVAYCKANPSWFNGLQMMTISMLKQGVEQALESP
jgi:hypothetical protein